MDPIDPVSPSAHTYADAVLAWADHLRAGGTTPWTTWLATTSTGTGRPRPTADDEPDVSPVSPTPGPPAVLPTGPQLELLRRLVQLAGGPLPGLDDVVLTGSVPGRGPVDVPLPWPDRPRFGSPPVDPADLPTEELLRVAVGVLSALLGGVRVPARSAAPPRWPLPGRTRFRVHGSPRAARVVRDDLLAAGWVESDWQPRHVVVGLPLEAFVGEHWDAATRRGSGLRWTTLWRRRRARGDLPGVVDLRATAARAGRGGDRVDVVLGRDLDDLRSTVARTFGLPAPSTTRPVPVVDAHAADLRRRLNPLLRLAAGSGTARADLARRLDAVLDPAPDGPEGLVDAGARERPPRLPDPVRDWAREAGEALATDLRAADYPVHGDPGLVGGPASSSDAGGDAGSGAIDPDSTLELALVACLRAWRLQEGRH